MTAARTIERRPHDERQDALYVDGELAGFEIRERMEDGDGGTLRLGNTRDSFTVAVLGEQSTSDLVDALQAKDAEVAGYR